MNILLGILTFALILISLFLILVVLAQKAKSDGGMGAAMGGGVAEATFGAETGNVLSKATINAAIAFFIISVLLFLGRVYQHHHGAADSGSALPNIAAPARIPVTPMQPSQPAPAGKSAKP
jgi:preprotein translocase subunit SecG